MLYNIYSEFNKMSSDSFLFHIVGESVPELQPIKTDGTWDVVGIDLMGPYFETERGSKYIFTATDLFSKFVFARPIKVLIALHSSVWLSIILCVHSYMHSLLPTFTHPFMDMVNDTRLTLLSALTVTN